MKRFLLSPDGQPASKRAAGAPPPPCEVRDPCSVVCVNLDGLCSRLAEDGSRLLAHLTGPLLGEAPDVLCFDEARPSRLVGALHADARLRAATPVPRPRRPASQEYTQFVGAAAAHPLRRRTVI